jgi:predicted nucleic acid-binding protein
MDQSDAGKRKKCRSLIQSLTAENKGVISTQVMQEFYVAATNKLGADPLLIKDILRSLERFETVVVTSMLIKEAIDCSIINRLSFWDALIVVSAESAHCETLWTEDLNHGQVIRGVRIENPLK